MIQSRGILGDLIAAIPQVMFLAKTEALKKVNNWHQNQWKKATKYYINKGINKINKRFTSSKGPGVTLTNNEIKDIMKVIKSFENRGILLRNYQKSYQS